ncbi:unnamed protein product [Urochloa decumbens]|uniref:BHLH domain-containing protein n=1 Tax=Urochloa decumbens TaxID=240449 RepID=A0ABC8YZH6_9POAL
MFAGPCSLEGFHDDGMGSVPFGDAGLFDGFYGGFGGGGGHDYGYADYGFGQLGGASTSSPVVLVDGGAEPEEVDAAAASAEKRDRRAEKAAMALKSHSEAERRRRERINAHLATLRTMVPCNDKMDKAALLAEVITHVKKLKASAARIRSHCAAVPADADDVAVELVAAPDASVGGGGFLVKATLSCDDGADVFADVKAALRPLRLRVVGSEVTTLGGRVRITFLVSPPPCGGGGDATGAVAESVRQALQSVLDKASSALEFAPRASLLNKRRRVSTFESSSSSS